jgi:hypothetical protein
MEGFYAKFKIIENGLGVKTFKNKEVCDFAFNAQIMAYEMGYATKIIERLNDFEILMEVADTTWVMENLEEGVYYDTVFKIMAEKLKPILIKKPHKKNKNIKYMLDFHKKNLGIYKNRLVLIDFS